MWLTKNEKAVLKLLLDNSRLTDVTIANKLRISSQAVGKIRKQLEEEKIIQGYNTKINSKEIGITIFVLVRATMIERNKIKESEEFIKNLNNTIFFFRTMQRNNSYFMIFGFSGFEEAEDFLNENEEVRSKFRIVETFFYSQKDILKNSASNLMSHMINNSKSKSFGKSEEILPPDKVSLAS